jgi:hypothetical protein
MLGFLKGKSRAQRAATLFVTAAFLNLSSIAPRAATDIAARHTGEVTIANGLVVDGLAAMRGQTFFSGSRLAAAAKSISLLSLGNLARMELIEGATLPLDFDEDSFGGALEAGRLRVYAPRGVTANFSTADARVHSDASEAASFTLRSTEGFTEVSVQSGALEVRSNNSVRTLKAGESFKTKPDPQAQQNFSNRKRAGLIIAIASAVAIIAIVLTARNDEEEVPDFGGCVTILSPGAQPCS